MTIIVDFQEHANLRKKKDNDTRASDIFVKGGEIIFFNKEEVSL